MSSSVPPIKWTEGQERQLMASVCELHDVHIKKRDEVAICRVMRVPSHKICAIKRRLLKLKNVGNELLRAQGSAPPITPSPLRPQDRTVALFRDSETSSEGDTPSESEVEEEDDDDEEEGDEEEEHAQAEEAEEENGTNDGEAEESDEERAEQPPVHARDDSNFTRFVERLSRARFQSADMAEILRLTQAPNRKRKREMGTVGDSVLVVQTPPASQELQRSLAPVQSPASPPPSLADVQAAIGEAIERMETRLMARSDARHHEFTKQLAAFERKRKRDKSRLRRLSRGQR